MSGWSGGSEWIEACCVEEVKGGLNLLIVMKNGCGGGVALVLT